MSFELKRGLGYAYNAALSSKDRSTQNGAYIETTDGRFISACNNFPEGVVLQEDRLYGTDKYAYVEHAERAAIYAAARHGLSCDGSTMFAPWSACADCARAIISAGIKTVIRHEKIMSSTPERWRGTIVIAEKMMEEAGIEVIDYIGDIGAHPILFNGALWTP